MKHTNKKGFTIVELVIVIAVIAILAAVLIPTFTNLIKKANESSDMQAVRQMNTILAAENAFLGGITINDAVKALEEAGFNGDKYVPLVAGTYFFYDQNTKQIVYVDGEFNVLYPKGAEIEGHALFSLSGETPKEDYPAPVIDEVNNTATFTISTAAQFAQLSADFKALTNGEDELENFDTEVAAGITCINGKDIIISLSSNIDLKGSAFNLNLKDCNFTLLGNGYTISGVVNNSGFALSAFNEEQQVASYGGAFLGYVVNSTVLFDDVTFENCHFGNKDVKASAVFVGQLNGDSTVTFKDTKVVDCTVDGLKGVAVYVGHTCGTSTTQNIVFEGTNTVSNCELEATEKTQTGMIGTIVGRLSGYTKTVSISGAAPVMSNISIVSAGGPVSNADARSIIAINGIVQPENIVTYNGTAWSLTTPAKEQ